MKSFKRTLIAASIMGLFACGGGGGSDPAAPQTASVGAQATTNPSMDTSSHDPISTRTAPLVPAAPASASSVAPASASTTASASPTAASTFAATLTQAPADGATLCGTYPGNYLFEVKGVGMAKVDLTVDDPLMNLDYTLALRVHPFLLSSDGTTARLFINTQAQLSGDRHATITATDATGQTIVVATRVWTIRNLQASKGFSPCAPQTALS